MGRLWSDLGPIKIGQRTKVAFQISWICMNENQLWMYNMYIFLQLTFNFSLIQDNAAKCYFWQLFFIILSKPTLIWSSWHIIWHNICIVAIVCGHHLEICRDWSAKLGEHLSQKITLAHTYNPKIWPKMWPGWPKKQPTKFVWLFSPKGLLNLWAKYSEPKKHIAKIFFLS